MTTQNPANRPRALIAMSGGVDSSVAAWLMQRDGFDCTGVTMRLTRNEAVNTEGLHTCCSERDIEDAAEVAYAMDIPYEVLDFTADFQEKIIDKFIRVYEAGGTPNPCIDCNRYMKFDHLLRWAEAHGLDHVVTGHYARVEQDEATGRWLLKKGLDESKDQSYVLYNLTQEQLAHVRLPLGGLHKSEVRAIAEQQRRGVEQQFVGQAFAQQRAVRNYGRVFHDVRRRGRDLHELAQILLRAVFLVDAPDLQLAEHGHGVYRPPEGEHREHRLEYLAVSLYIEVRRLHFSNDLGYAVWVYEHGAQDRLLGRHRLDEHLQQLLLEPLGQIDDLLDDLPGKILEVLGHHDLGQMAIGLLSTLFHLLQIVHHAPLGHRSHRILDEFCTHGTGTLGQRILAVLRHLDLTQHLVGSLSRQTGNIGQTALRIGKLPRTAAQTIRIAQLIERVMQLAREYANLVVDVGGSLVATHGSEV